MYRVAHSVLEHRLGATSVVAFITKRAGLLRSQRSVRYFCGRRLWRGLSAAEVASLGWLLGRAACNGEYELRRMPKRRSSQNFYSTQLVNKGKMKAGDSPLRFTYASEGFLDRPIPLEPGATNRLLDQSA
jgi:hypothetical protein